MVGVWLGNADGEKDGSVVGPLLGMSMGLRVGHPVDGLNVGHVVGGDDGAALIVGLSLGAIECDGWIDWVGIPVGAGVLGALRN